MSRRHHSFRGDDPMQRIYRLTALATVLLTACGPATGLEPEETAIAGQQTELTAAQDPDSDDESSPETDEEKEDWVGDDQPDPDDDDRPLKAGHDDIIKP